MRYLFNFLLINFSKIFRIIKLILINTILIVFLSIIFVPYLQKFIFFISKIEIDNSIINTFLGALIGINFTSFISKKNALKDFYKNHRAPVYFEYKESLRKAVNYLDSSEKYKLFFLNYRFLEPIYDIQPHQLPILLMEPLQKDKDSIYQLFNKIEESKKSITDYVKIFFDYNNETIIKEEKNILRILDILLSDYTNEEKEKLINIHFNEFKKKNSCEGKMADDFICWAFKHPWISTLNELSNNSIKTFRRHYRVLDFNSNYISKILNQNIYREV